MMFSSLEDITCEFSFLILFLEKKLDRCKNFSIMIVSGDMEELEVPGLCAKRALWSLLCQIAGSGEKIQFAV